MTSTQLTQIIAVWLRRGVIGLGLLTLHLACFAIAVVLALVLRPLAPVILAFGIISVVAVLVWRSVARRVDAQRSPRAYAGQGEGDYHGVALPADAALDDNHTWVRRSGPATAAVGADDLAVRLLGPVDAVVVSAPVGAQVRRGDALFALVRGDRRLAVRSPVGGRVLAHNRSALHRPSLVNTSPYEHGWIVSLGVPDLARQQSALRDPPSASAWFRAEVDRALAMVAPGGPMPAMPDGGLVSPDLHRLIDDETWSRIHADFFERAPGAAAAPEQRS
jgi:glycine cleavage system H protein